MVAIAVRMIGQSLKWRLPELLIAIVVAGAAHMVVRFGQCPLGRQTGRPNPRTLPWFQLPVWDWSLVRELAPSALAVRAPGFARSHRDGQVDRHQDSAKAGHQSTVFERGPREFNRQLLSLLSGFWFTDPFVHQLSSWGRDRMVGHSLLPVQFALTVLLFAPLAQFIRDLRWRAY